nr:ATP-binding protein [uncultured Oscillibacter sp.]
MLLKFRCDNFKAFRDGFEFNMVPEKRMTELNYSILKEQIGKRKVNALSSSVIYGPNAAGKTSIVNAMSCMRQIVLQGGMKDVSGDPADGQAISAQLIPFAFQETARPVCFDAWFTFHDVEYRYEVGIYLGKFLEKQVDPYITEESLYVNGSLIYRREENEVTELSLPSVKKFLNTGYTLEETDTTRKKMSDNLVSDSLLLTTDFNSFCSKRIVSEIVAWFKTQFMVINSSNYVRFYPSFPEKNNAVLDHTINRIAQEAGIIGSAFIYVQDAKTHSPQLMSLFQTNDQENPYGLDADQIESVGTLRLISIMPAVISALEKGAVLVMDELDASLHPMIVMNLISIFHNDEVNTRRAQLIFNTHNPIYLSHKLLRRDEIKFVERDKETKSSNLYALSDFKANGEASVRKTSDYMKNYFINRYGAIEDIDFTDIVSDILNGELAEEGGTPDGQE